VIASSGSWEGMVTEAAARIVARGGRVRAWAPLVEALRTAVEGFEGVAEQAPVAPPVASGLRAATSEFAADLLLRQSWLQALLELLADRRQVVLYGPPGTGKTWLARRIAEHAFAAEDVRLVQFHPSYTYEDFVEGYRPVTSDGSLTYELVSGPLRELSAQAAAHPERPHLLIVDEINRGNLPKIFGELYFLLEYRDEPMRLQYSSHAEFRLPPNLYVLGTMNTADRSIALLDAALRRRFAFLELSPRSDPVHGLLGRWLERHNLDPEPQTLLETLNDMLAETDGDEDLAIGPSYFMSRSRTEPDLETIWEFDLLPLLVERFYGSGLSVHEKFSLAAVRNEATSRADAADPAQ
jgi:5-methylcytosine-specific restriction protein B